MLISEIKLYKALKVDKLLKFYMTLSMNCKAETNFVKQLVIKTTLFQLSSSLENIIFKNNSKKGLLKSL